MKCDVADDNGAPIALDAHSKDNNSYVSGINCYSQGGTSSCQGNGTFEFRVNGVNDGSTVLMSTVEVVASANGVPSPTQDYTFKVDPSAGGF
ncbi:MAG TPA: hypothetical protein VFI84_04385 [Candidatus Saccharimonadales bacterium]|nr:hypothetical protein [Candidatus Saccharimonadales bacterium]